MSQLQPKLKRFCRQLGVFFIFLGVSGLQAPPAIALQQIERITGLDRSFVAGYSLRDAAETVHSDQVFEFTQEGESAIYKEGEEKEQEEDLWVYVRKLDGGVLFNTNDKSLAHDPVGNLIYTFIPTLFMSRRSQDTSVDLGYKATVSRKAQNAKAASANHLLFGAFGYHFEKMNFDINESFSPRSVLEQGERTELQTDDASQRSVFAFTNDSELTWDTTLTEKTQASFSYKNHTLYFPTRAGSLTNNTSLSEMTHSYSPKVSYQLTPRIKAFTQFTRQIKDFFKGGNFNSRVRIVSLGAETRVWKSVVVNLSGGYFTRSYQRFGIPNSTGGIYKVSISKPLTRKMTASFFASNEIGEEFDETASPSLKRETQVYGVNATYALTPHTSIVSSANASFLYRPGQVTAVDPENLTRTLTRPNDKESYLWGIGISWNPRRPFSAFVGYDFENKKAAFLNSEAKSHRVAVTATYVF